MVLHGDSNIGKTPITAKFLNPEREDIVVANSLAPDKRALAA
jgi:hypothetical protein